MHEPVISYSVKHIGQEPGTVVRVDYKYDSDLFIEVFDYNIAFIEEKELKSIKKAFQCKSSDTETCMHINGLSHIEVIEKEEEH